MRKNHFLYHGKYSGIYRIAAAKDAQTVSALLAEGWVRTTLAEVRTLRKSEAVADRIAEAYIDTSGELVIIEPD